MAANDELTTTVSTKGQVILPKAIRDERRWSPGTKLVVEDTAEGVLLREAAPAHGMADAPSRYAHAPRARSIEEAAMLLAAELRRLDAERAERMEIVPPRRPGGLVEWLEQNPLPAYARRSAEEIDADIQEQRESWD